MRKRMVMMTLVLALVGGACAGDAIGSDEDQALENELAAVQQQLSDTETDLATVQAEAEQVAVSQADIPDDVAAVLDAWWAANEREDGSVVDLYLPNGYHLYGDQKFGVDEIAAHLGAEGWSHELIAGPYLVAAEPEGRYVVTEGVRNSLGGRSFASALTFELVTRDGELKIAETGWTHVTN